MPYHEPDDWSNHFTHAQISEFLFNFPMLAEHLRKLHLQRFNPEARLTSWTILRDWRTYMSRPKGRKNDPQIGNQKLPTSDTGGGNLRWLNIKFEPADVAELEQSTATLEFLSARVLAILSPQCSLSVRYVDGGKSVCVSLIYSASFSGISGAYGLSGFGGNPRDAFLCLVYKFDILMDADWNSIPELLADTQSVRRFG